MHFWNTKNLKFSYRADNVSKSKLDLVYISVFIHLFKVYIPYSSFEDG